MQGDAAGDGNTVLMTKSPAESACGHVGFWGGHCRRPFRSLRREEICQRVNIFRNCSRIKAIVDVLLTVGT